MLKVIGLGNTLRGDDGIGPAVIDALRNAEDPELQLIDLGADAFDLLAHLHTAEPVVVIDCARMGRKPGSVRRFPVDGEQLAGLDRLISLHGFSFSEIYRLAETLGPVAPCCCIGVEPLSIEFGAEMSPEVQATIPSVIKMVFEEKHLYEEKNNNH